MYALPPTVDHHWLSGGADCELWEENGSSWTVSEQVSYNFSQSHKILEHVTFDVSTSSKSTAFLKHFPYAYANLEVTWLRHFMG